MQPAGLLHVQRPPAVEEFGGSGRRAEEPSEVLLSIAFCGHDLANRVDRRGGLDTPVLPLIGADQRKQDLEAVALGRASLRLAEEVGFDFRQRGGVVGFTVDRAKIVHGLLYSRPWSAGSIASYSAWVPTNFT